MNEVTVSRDNVRTAKQYTDIEEFLNDWGRKIRTCIISFGFRDPDIDDIFQDLIEEFIARDYISHYDPEKGTWATYVYGFVNVRLLAHANKRKQHIHKNAQLDTLDWLGLGNLIEENQFETLKAVEAELSKLEVKGKRDLRRLFVDIAKQIFIVGEKSQTTLAKKYRISDTSISYQMSDLRDALVEAGLVEFDVTGKAYWT